MHLRSEVSSAEQSMGKRWAILDNPEKADEKVQGLEQCFSAFLMPGPFNTVAHVVGTSNHKII